ncbi:MAG: hypothetical protein MJA29_02330, partial [Candidatus Omnitrophica bacterium]|nr:hypothetical protein [Candidatus Omnitrophota bacterium]
MISDYNGKKGTPDVNELKGTVHELATRTHRKLVKTVGEKCLVQLDINGTSEEVLWDTGAQV